MKKVSVFLHVSKLSKPSFIYAHTECNCISKRKTLYANKLYFDYISPKATNIVASWIRFSQFLTNVFYLKLFSCIANCLWMFNYSPRSLNSIILREYVQNTAFILDYKNNCWLFKTGLTESHFSPFSKKNNPQIIELNLRAHPNKQKLIRKRRLAERQACRRSATNSRCYRFALIFFDSLLVSSTLR